MDGISVYMSGTVTEANNILIIGCVIGIFLILAGFFTTKSFRYSRHTAMLGIALEFGCFILGLFFFRVPVGYVHVAKISPDVIESQQFSEKYYVLENADDSICRYLEVPEADMYEIFEPLENQSDYKRRLYKQLLMKRRMRWNLYR